MSFNPLDCGCNDNYNTNPNNNNNNTSNNLNTNPNNNNCEYIQGNSTDLHINPKDCEVRVDLRVNRKKGVRVWGQVKDCENIAVSGVLVKLLKVINYCGKQDFVGVSHTITDCNGFYQFELNKCDDSDYKIIVSKDASGNERTVSTDENDCEPCVDSCVPVQPNRPSPCIPGYPPTYNKPNKPHYGCK